MDLPKSVLEAFVQRCVADADAQALTDPYLPYYLNAEDTSIAPETYDEYARARWNVPNDSPARLRFVAWVMCDKAAREGHSSLRWGAARDAVMRVCGVERPAAIEALKSAIEARGLAGWRDSEGGAWVGLAPLVRAEQCIAASVRARFYPPQVLPSEDGSEGIINQD